MNPSALFIRRPVATTLLALAIALPGLVALKLLPIASMPEVDLPSIGVSAGLPGAGPETMAATVAMPLERSLGRIAGITEMTSTSTQGRVGVNLQFELERDVNAAAREVQAAINAAGGLLPGALPTRPTYRKANAASSAVVGFALTSETHTQAQLYELAFNVLAQKVGQVKGIGNVNVNGSALRSVRVEVDPEVLDQRGISLEQVRLAVAAANPSRPKGLVEDRERRWQVDVNDRAWRAVDYRDLIVAWRDGAPVRLSEIATVRDSVQDLRNAGSSSGKPAVVLTIFNQPDANVVEAVDGVKALLPRLRDLVPADVHVIVTVDRATTVRRSLNETAHALALAVGLVILVTLLFLRSGRATLIPAAAIPVSLLGTLAVIYLCGFSLNNLSLMALIVAASFVVDDAIVVVENISRHIEEGLAPLEAAYRGAREVGFTVLAMNVSLVAAFIPLLLMGGIIGRLFREFAVTLSVAVAISLFVSLSVTPMLGARLLRAGTGTGGGWLERLTEVPQRAYVRSLAWTLRHGWLMLALLAATVALNGWLYAVVPKDFFPQQDTGRLQGNFQAEQDISFAAMRRKVDELMKIVGQDPAIDTWYEYTGGSGRANTGTMFASLKPREERDASAQEVVDRLRPKLAKVTGATLMLRAQQDLNIGARSANAQHQYTLLASDYAELSELAPRLQAAMSRLPEITDVSSDFQDKGRQTRLVVDRDAASRLGVTAQQIDAALNNAFGQRLVSTIYEPLNQYYVVLTLAPQYTRDPSSLESIHLIAETGARVPLAAIARYEETNASLAVNHESQFASATLSFNLASGVSLDRATRAIEAAFTSLRPSDSVIGRFSGTAGALQDVLESQPWLITGALLTIYIVLGMLYENALHPLTILSTLPSAGVGALLALILFGSEFSVIALIGIVLLVGIVMKNAIILIDCALQLGRERGLASAEAIREACRLRFRPILMTTLAAMFGALPLALGTGDGAELRRPLGISIVGGLFVSQILTLYITPSVYLALDRLRPRRSALVRHPAPS